MNQSTRSTSVPMSTALLGIRVFVTGAFGALALFRFSSFSPTFGSGHPVLKWVYASLPCTHLCGFRSQGCVPGHLVLSDSLQPHGLKPSRLLCPWNFPGKNTGMVVISYSRGSFQPRDQTCVSYISRQILYPWATWEALWYQGLTLI